MIQLFTGFEEVLERDLIALGGGSGGLDGIGNQCPQDGPSLGGTMHMNAGISFNQAHYEE